MSAGGRSAAGASADYYAHRPDQDGEREYRPGFDAENEEMSKNEVYSRIEEGEGDYAYRIVLSPGEEMDAEELRDWARDVMEPVEEDGGEWVGFVHDDQTEHPHAHIIAYTEEKLDRDDLTEMRQIGTEGAEHWAEYKQELERDPTQEHEAGVERQEDQEQRADREASRSAQPEPATDTSGDSSGKSAAEWARQAEYYSKRAEHYAEHYAKHGAYLIKREEQISGYWIGRAESYAENYAEQGVNMIERGMGTGSREPITEKEREEKDLEAEHIEHLHEEMHQEMNEQIDRESEEQASAFEKEPEEPPAEALHDPMDDVLEESLRAGRAEEPLEEPVVEPFPHGREEEHGLE